MSAFALSFTDGIDGPSGIEIAKNQQEELPKVTYGLTL